MLRLIEALVVASREYGDHWKVIHFGSALRIERTDKGVYEAHDQGVGLFSWAEERLERVLSDFAERYPYELLDEQWKASH